MKQTLNSKHTAYPNHTTPTFLSLFCGCGGLDLGFTQEGYRCIGAFDNDPIAIETHRANHGDIAQLFDLSQGRLPSAFDGQADVIIAGTPCQGFSTIGKRKPDDPRNFLLEAAGQIACYHKPKVFIAENVLGARSGLFSARWAELESMLRKNGYQVISRSVKATETGVAQLRKRLILLAWNGNQKMVFPFPQKPPTLGEVLAGVEKISDHDPRPLKHGSKDALIAQRIQPGRKLCNVRNGVTSVRTWDIPEVYGTVTDVERIVLETLSRLRRRLRKREVGDADPVTTEDLTKALGSPATEQLATLEKKGFTRRIGSHWDLTCTFNGLYRRLEKNKFSMTVDTRFGSSRLFLHPDEDRGFSTREAARIQGFPDDFTFPGNRQQQFRMIGNAVPPPMAAWIARAARSVLSN